MLAGYIDARAAWACGRNLGYSEMGRLGHTLAFYRRLYLPSDPFRRRSPTFGDFRRISDLSTRHHRPLLRFANRAITP